MGWRSRRKLPVRFWGASVASHTIVSAPSSTERGAPEPLRSVRTQPGQTEFTEKFGNATASCEVTPVERCLGDAVSWRPSISSVGQLPATAGDIDHTRCAAFGKQRGERPRDMQRSELVGFKRLSDQLVVDR